ncbi:CMRF35-like molecule 5 [Muntiacus reevesi]|uniref:CMRF35-like molecule 5 n=1 Tax=Muntiacus reevesi TaxID=9886 RepID=UPI003307C43F
MGGRTTCLFPALLLLIIPGSSAISGPRAVRGVEQESLTVRCRYDPGWETYVKWWCRGADWGSCRFIIKNTGSEKEVKKGRVSIKDNWKDRSFTVTMEKLRLDDADTYWCGIERVGADLGNRVKVTIDPAVALLVPDCDHPRSNSRSSRLCREGKDPGSLPTCSWAASVLGAPRPFVLGSVTLAGVFSRRSSVSFLRVNLYVACAVWGSGDTDKEPLLRSSDMATLSLGLGRDGSQCGWHSWPLLGSVHFLLLVFLKVPLLLSLLGAVLWVNRPLRSSGGKPQENK